jgi:hypothetical protein
MKNFIVLLGLILIVGCNNKPKNINRIISEAELQEIQNISPMLISEGEELLTTSCYSCHSPNSKSHDDMLAPPLGGIKHKYKGIYPDRNVFIAQMSSFIIEPTKDNALMKGPVKKFSLMPITTLSDKQILELTAFIYDNKLVVPLWFPKHFEEKHGKKWTE